MFFEAVLRSRGALLEGEITADPQPAEETGEYSRRLPIYLLIDCSESMVGDPIAAIEEGLHTFLNDLQKDPIAVETVWLSVITFGTVARLIMPLTELKDFELPHLEAGGATYLGEAIRMVNSRIRQEVRKTSDCEKGDWKPMVYIFTDGDPNDEWTEAAKDFRNQKLASIIACGAGNEVQDETLKVLSDKAVKLRDTAPATLKGFVKYLTASVSSKSRQLGSSAGAAEDYWQVSDEEMEITIVT